MLEVLAWYRCAGVTSTPLLDRLRALNWRLTPQRRVIAEVMEGDHVHLTAEDLAGEAVAAASRITALADRHRAGTA